MNNSQESFVKRALHLVSNSKNILTRKKKKECWHSRGKREKQKKKKKKITLEQEHSRGKKRKRKEENRVLTF